jgi:hypothetical protein
MVSKERYPVGIYSFYQRFCLVAREVGDHTISPARALGATDEVAVCRVVRKKAKRDKPGKEPPQSSDASLDRRRADVGGRELLEVRVDVYDRD